MKEGDIIRYCREDSGMVTAEGFEMKPGVPVVVGVDVVLPYAERLVSMGVYCLDEPLEEAVVPSVKKGKITSEVQE